MNKSAGIGTKATILALLLPAFFPYVGFVSGFDLQPNALFSLLLLLVVATLFGKVRANALYLGLIVGTLLVCLLRVLIQYTVGDTTDHVSSTTVSFAQTCFHLLTILAVYLVVRSELFVPRSAFILLVLAVYVAFGVLQLLIDEDIGSFLVYRGFEALSDSGRGVRSLASEPAVFGNLLLIMSGFLMLVAIREGWSKRAFVVSQATITFMTIILSQSAYAILTQLMVFALSVLVVSVRLFLVLLGVLIWLTFAFIVSVESEGIRVLFIFQTLLENPALLYEQGAMRRVMNVPISVYGAFLHGAFGSGFGATEFVTGAVPALPGNPFHFVVADRNLGGLVELLLRLGIGAVPLFLALLIANFRITAVKAQLSPGTARIGIPLALVVFLTSFTYSSIGNPMIWLLFFSAIGLANKYRRA